MLISKLLSDIYYHLPNPASYSSPVRLWKVARKKSPKLTLRQVNDWFHSQAVPTRFRQAQHKFPRSKFIVGSQDSVWGADLIQLTRPDLKRANRNYAWILIITDLFSRKIEALVALKNKTSRETAEALTSVFSNVSSPPKILFTDKGKEFLGRETQQVCKTHGVQHRFTQDVTQKVAPTERQIRAVKTKLWKHFAHTKSFNWVDHLPAVK